jgi:hypothetical protein
MTLTSVKDQFDTNMTFLYKWADYYGIPTIHMIVRRDTLGNIQYVNTYEEIVNMINEDTVLEEIYKKYRKLNQKIGHDLIIYLFYNVKVLSVGLVRINDDDLEKVVNLDKSTRMGQTKYQTPEDVTKYYEAVRQKFGRYINEDAERLEVINDVQKILVDSYHPFPFSGFNATTVTLSISPIFSNGYQPEIEHGIDIFDSSQATIFTPYISYVDSHGKEFFKILKGDIDYQDIGVISTSGKNLIKDSINIILWLGDNKLSVSNRSGYIDIFDPTRLVNANSTSFYQVIYDLKSGTLDVAMPSRKKGSQVTDADEVLSRLELGLRGLTIRHVNQRKIRGNFDIYGDDKYDIDIDEISFLHAILETNISKFLYVEEKIKPFSYKKRMDLHWNELYSRVGEQIMVHYDNGSKYPMSMNSVAFTVQIAHSSTDVQMPVMNIEGHEYTISIPKGKKWARFTIIGGATEDDLYKAISHLSSVFKIYSDVKESIKEEYHFISTGMSSQLNRRYHVKDETSDSSKGTSLLDDLKRQVPDIFVDGYADVCPGAIQPILISPENLGEWTSGTFQRGGQTHNRQALHYPRDDPQWHFGCPGTDSPFPGVKLSKELSNGDRYPYVPCCFKKDQTRPGASTKYNLYYNGPESISKVKKPSTNQKVSWFMGPGLVAKVPSTLRNVLGTYREEGMYEGIPDDWEFMRYGVPDGPNTLLHCILDAISFEGYNGNQQLVNIIRESIARSTNPALLKQEMYDYDDKTITELLGDTNRFLDPEIFYRAFEEYFEINIYIFELKKSSGQKDEGLIRVPRHKSLYIKSARNERPSILVLKHYGSDPKLVEYPRCELLVDYNDTVGGVVKIFDFTMTHLLHELLTSANYNITWLKYNHYPLPINSKPHQLYPHQNIFGQVDYSTLLEGEGNLVAQYIDSYGKSRAYTYSYPNEVFISFVTLPGIPSNVTHYPILGSPDPHIVSFHLSGSKPVTRSIDFNGMTTGIWFQLFEITEGIYVPIKPSMDSDLPHEYAMLPHGSDNPITLSENLNITKRYIKIKRDLGIIYDLIEWLYELERRDNPNIAPEEFFSNTTIYDEFEGDSMDYYDFSKVIRKLPSVTDKEKGLSYILSRVTFKSGDQLGKLSKFPLYSGKFGDQVKHRMTEYGKKTMGAKPLVKKYIDNYYLTSTDFIPSKNNIIIIDNEVYNKWKDNYIVSLDNVFDLRTTLRMSIVEPIEPRLYIDGNKNIWMIQNSILGEKHAALAISRNWWLYRVNSGAHTNPIDEELTPPYYLYSIGISGSLVLREDMTGGSENFVNLLHYTKYDRYAALLPLL